MTRTEAEQQDLNHNGNRTMRAQLAGLRLQISYSLMAQVTAGLVLTLLVWKDDTRFQVVSWLTYFATSYGVATWWSFRLTNPDRPLVANPRHALQLFALGSILRTSPWGVAVWMLLPGDLVGQLTVLVMIFALLTGIPTTLGAYFPAVVLFALPMLVPIAIRFLTLNTPFTSTIGVGLLLFIPLYLGAIRRANRTVLDNYALRFRNDLLIEELKVQARAEVTLREKAHQSLEIAERASHDKTRFLAAASHDLRQPVHAIGLFVAALKAEALTGRTKYLVDRLDRSLAGLDDLFNRLLDISRLDAGVIESSQKSFGLAAIAQTLETRFATMAQSRNLRFHVHCSPGLYVRSDPTLLIELLMNLLSNAFRYTEKGGVLLAMRRRGDQVLIQIWDTGCGIAPKNQEVIYNEFVQLENPARDRRKGLGLGLAIVKRLSITLGHPLSLRSREGIGSVFQIALPRVTAPEALNSLFEIEAPEMKELNGTLVLVVDDEIDILAAMEAVLGSWGCYAILARSIEEALKYVEASPRFPDVLLTDHRLTDHQTSFDVVDALTAALPYQLPVIVVSGEPSTSLEKQILARGWQFINKPVSSTSLRLSIGTALKLGMPAAPLPPA